MDPDGRPTGSVSPESNLTAHHPEPATDVPSDTTTTQPVLRYTSGPATWSSSPHLDSQSRNNLRQASVALDTAYERITSLRNSINNMLNRIPPELAGTAPSPNSAADASDAQPRPSLAHDNNIRPPHSALVLSGEQVVEELNQRAARLRSLIPPSARQRLEEFESNSRGNSTRRESAWDRFSHSVDRRSDVHPAPLRPRTPPMPDLVLPRARDLVDPRTSQRRDLQTSNQDDSSTMIGRRVAARVNAPSNQGSLSSRMSFSQIEQRLQAQTAQVARELENMTERLNARRRVELASSWVRGDNAAAAQDNGTTPSRVMATGDPWSNPMTTSGRFLRPARDVTLVDTTRIVLPQPTSRNSSDGTPVEELSPPARRSLSAAFREHIAAYRENVQPPNVSQDTPRNLATAPEVRGALVNLLARDREDQLPSAQPADYTPSFETGRRDDATVQSSSNSQGRRRRGWTRLNADGDEIDSDEDDHVVSPSTRRLRMRFAYGTANTDQSTTRTHTVTIEDILWRTSGSDSEADALSPDSTESCQSSLFHSSPPRPSVRCPYPLPTAVENMVVYPTPKPTQQPRFINVAKHASLAGR